LTARGMASHSAHISLVRPRRERAMAAYRPEAILYDILDRCAARGGGTVNPDDPAVAVLLRRGLIELRGLTQAQTTARGHDTMRMVLGARSPDTAEI
jgi:hypothetical protein